MRKIFFLILFFTAVIVSAQDIVVNRMETLQSTKAQSEARKDKNGKKCAIVLVDVVGKDKLNFKEAFGEVKYLLNEYTVYLTEGTKQLSITDGKNKIVAIFDDFDITIESGVTYKLILETSNKLRSACFYIKPKDAVLKFNNQKMEKNDDGIYVINDKIGKYDYTITANGFKEVSGQVELTEGELVVTKDIELEEKKYPVQITCSHPQANLFIDDIPFGTVESQSNLMLTEGKHNIRITNKECKDYESNYAVKADDVNTLNVSLSQYKNKYIYHRYERTKSTGNYRPHYDLNVSGGYFLDEKSTMWKANVEFHQYYGIIAFKEGLGAGVLDPSDNQRKELDDYKDVAKSDNNVVFVMDVPLQAGIAIPLSRYNTSSMAFLAGGYGAYYYIGHSSENMEDKKAVSTNSFDFGLRANVQFYINKFTLGVEWNNSLSKYKLGSSIGVSLGYRFYIHNK